MLNRAQIWDWSIGTGPEFRTWPVLKQTFSPSYNAAAAKIFTVIDNFGQKRWPQFSPLASLLMPAPRLKRTREQWNESFDRNRTIRQQLDELADEKEIFIQCSFLGTAVTVGVTMFVLSISELSEVGMVRKEKYLTLLITLASCSVVKV